MRVFCVLLAAMCGCRSARQPLEVDLERGVLLVTATDFSNDEGTTRDTTLLCGEALMSKRPELVHDFQVTIDDLPARCSRDECWTPGWEFGAATRFIFEGQVLVSVARTSVGLTDVVLADEAAWVEAGLRERATRRCP
jgi:hypothetical protein